MIIIDLKSKNFVILNWKFCDFFYNNNKFKDIKLDVLYKQLSGYNNESLFKNLQ